jgi:hypothetical protein
MCIQILGQGPLAEPIARLAERAGVTVQWSGATAGSEIDEPVELVILVSALTTMETDPAGWRDAVVVDATTSSQTVRAMAPAARIVRAFVSVPAQAFIDLINRAPSNTAPKLAVPLAGDDREAKVLVAAFMRQIGVEPFDLGALSAGEVLDPGGALSGKALSQVEMLEAVGWLAGDG